MTEIVGFWNKHVSPNLSLYERLVQAGFAREKEKEKSVKERIATSGRE
jgi:hypothetical protein